MTFIKLGIDYEHPSRQWWESGGRELWEAIAGEADASKVIVDAALADSWWAEAAQLPGWDAGPEYAPHPVTRAEVDEEEAELEG